MIVVLTPIIDILPLSFLMVFLFTIYAYTFYPMAQIKVDKVFLSYLNIWVLVSLIGIICAGILNYIIHNSIVEPVKYFIRIAGIYIVVFSSMVICVKSFAQKINIEKLVSIIYWLLIGSALFEYGLKFLGDRTFLSFYKARQDLGGIDTLHFHRFSGFWSFPGDVAAVIVLSIALIFNSNTQKYKIIKILCLLALLLLSQSKAGIAMLLITAFVFSVLTLKLHYILSAIIAGVIFMPYIFSVLEVHFEYLYKFIERLPYYLTNSKRAQEVLLYLNSDVVQKLSSLVKTQNLYESEIMGSLSRLGIVGSIWLLCPIAFVSWLSITSRSNIMVWSCLVAFFVFYLSISAGLSRIKILIPYMLVLTTLVIEKQKQRTDVN